MPRQKLRWYQFSLRALLLAAAAVALFFGTNGCGIVGLRYPRAVENDPLLAPVRVLSVEGNKLRLEDGRILCVDDLHVTGTLRQLLSASDNRVDVEADDSGRLLLFVKRRAYICGTSWVRLLNIRLIPVDVRANYREPIAFATDETPPRMPKGSAEAGKSTSPSQ